jgi:hypothetical protein
MNDPELPPDLASLQRQLADRPRIEPSPEFGARVLAASRAALGQRPPAVLAPGWRRWAAVAAAVLFGINLSMSVAADTDWHLLPGPEPGQVAATVNQLRELAPDLPESELRRQALLARAGAALSPTVPLTPNWERLRTTKEPDQWDER